MLGSVYVYVLDIINKLITIKFHVANVFNLANKDFFKKLSKTVSKAT